MTNELLPPGRNAAVSALAAEVKLEAVPEDDVIHGSPVQGITELGTIGNCDAGIWELQDGVVRDTESEELFVVISGQAMIEFLGTVSGEVLKTVTVQAGDVMRLIEGSRTRWTVKDHIRKVYLTP